MENILNINNKLTKQPKTIKNNGLIPVTKKCTWIYCIPKTINNCHPVSLVEREGREKQTSMQMEIAGQKNLFIDYRDRPTWNSGLKGFW